ncbi:MAG: DUF2812 domain-containing protein [Dehalococcoidales bacterium]|nr:DUF2812 domain-containing protein [Dehalococcoidales bacterium]
MSEYKTRYKAYSAWNYENEVEELNKLSEEGWQLVKAGNFHSKFRKNDQIRYRYQMDYGNIEDMGRYIETFREQGWEYVNSTYNHWHYFRKVYDPSLPASSYEIFTDRESLKEMTGRWAKMAFIMSAVMGLMALIYLIMLIRMPQLPYLLLFLTLGIESIVMLRGAFIMNDPDANRNRRGDTKFLYVFLIVLILGCAGSITTAALHTHVSTTQQASSMDFPKTDEDWNTIKIRLPDLYYLDLDIGSTSPVTVTLVNEDGETVFTKTSTDFHAENIRLPLSSGDYKLLLSASEGFKVDLRLD